MASLTGQPAYAQAEAIPNPALEHLQRVPQDLVRMPPNIVWFGGVWTTGGCPQRHPNRTTLLSYWLFSSISMFWYYLLLINTLVWYYLLYAFIIIYCSFCHLLCILFDCATIVLKLYVHLCKQTKKFAFIYFWPWACSNTGPTTYVMCPAGWPSASLRTF